MDSTADRHASFREVFAFPEFRAIWFAQILSVLGDMLAFVALTVLVFDRTHSSALTALTAAVNYLPYLIGGPLLSVLADRLPRRAVMIGCDLTRAGLVVVMALPGAPLWALVLMLFAVNVLAPPFQAARSAIVPDVLPGDHFVLGTAVTRMTQQTGQALGFPVGGALVAGLGARPCLGLDAVSFLGSAVLLWLGVRHRPAAITGAAASVSTLRTIATGMRVVFGDERLLTLLMLGWLMTFYVMPEGLAVPYTKGFGGGPVAAGLVLAASPLGGIIGAFLFGRFVDPPRRLRWMGALAVGSCAPLTLAVFHPGLGLSLLVFALSGLATAYQLAASAAFVSAVPDQVRGQAFGFAQTGLAVGQGVSISLAGLVAQALGPGGPAIMVAVSGLLGTAAALALATRWRRMSTRTTPALEPVSPPTGDPAR
jgi:MFS family permease